ncbi:MAG: RNA polymerase II mediator complex subunit [Chrysothrix sp. TS-e1954]|nr:MAG: RNA polymerase II mediator complex subunit [Chrysothrix sp. TS-e1954]
MIPNLQDLQEYLGNKRALSTEGVWIFVKMGAISIFLETLRSSVILQVAITFVALLGYPVAQAIYNTYFHPLAKIPGPTPWCASRIPFVYNLLVGKLIQRQRQLHDRYGPIFRMAPDEVSFASEDAYNDIYTWRKGHRRAIRDPAFAVAPEGQADNIITTSNVVFHARVRGLLSHSFTEDSLKGQSLLIEGHADMFIDQLRRIASSAEATSKGGLTNLTDWINFFTMDVIGDLAFGEAFGCLASEGTRRHQQYAYDKITRRLDSKSNRPDFMTPFMKANPNFENMSRDEMMSTFTFLIVGGSETSATVMTGIMTHLCAPQNRQKMERLTNEIRARYATEDTMTIDTVNDAHLPYLDAVINEGMRLCHPVPSGMPRMVPQGGDDYAGVHLPAGTRLGVRIFAVNRSAMYFRDPDAFVPERWLPQGEKPREFDRDRLSASKPFSLGFHSCLGRPLAWLEMRLIITRLLWAFDVAEEDGKHVEFDNFPVMMMIVKQAFEVRLRARQGVQCKTLKPGDEREAIDAK